MSEGFFPPRIGKPHEITELEKEENESGINRGAVILLFEPNASVQPIIVKNWFPTLTEPVLATN